MIFPPTKQKIISTVKLIGVNNIIKVHTGNILANANNAIIHHHFLP